ncbi:GTP-binding protein TypA [Thiohalorhabdus denitrificans]|uniref:Large ribosomal subunit assembly factor BipA n=1 Tax=Thiohalorhabdus denitrificans TaxID=381306 RepID=A0A0P9C864_9GAMM|nr:translational GTPase TypA [Thiohalorhabdus denitrificans]KPV39396.1 GTP-binding protein TypA [Thiohalorhabdus denitrificans]SCY67448.1 GTP-binding protein [Thiohalorhabdus denitrificans]
MIENLRNIAIIAHVDHGKTTLVDRLLQQSGTLDERAPDAERIMDSTDLEKERGITILSKNTAIDWEGYRINIVDTPGHADFGGEVERVLSMVDSVLLLVDAVDGPMPQTRFVTEKALARGLQPIVVVNKVDRPGSRPDWVVDQTFDLFDNLGANDDQLDFPVVYCSALEGYASEDSEAREGDMTPLFQTIVDNVAVPDVDPDAPFQLQVSALDYNKFTGVIGVGRVTRGTARRNQQVSIIDRHGETRSGKISQVFGFRGLEKIEVEEASAGDIISFTGIDPLSISDTLCDPAEVEPLPALTVDEPTVSMNFLVNKSPFAGREGKYVTSRQIKDRLEQELVHNVALRVEQTEDAEKFRVSGRGELHLATLIETMRREGYELAVSRPEVVIREIEGAKEEPYEHLTVDVPEDHQGTVMEKVGERGGELKDMAPDGKGRVRMDYEIPARGLIGFRSEFLTATSGEGLMFHVFDHYGPVKPGDYGRRVNGVLISMSTGKTVEYALFNLQDRGAMFVGPGEDCYEGQIVGRHVRDNDLTVNPFKGKQLTNVRAAGSDENVILVPPEKPSLEEALEFIDDDELVEVTPESIRLRKKLLTETERKKAGRAG